MSNPETIVAPDSIQWWREARFGLFIHWGLYAQPAGVWKGKEIPSIGEWIMYNAKIPIAEYAALAKTFNPVKFDAEAWASLAARAGMKYLVITAKHHDGFAMFRSPSNPYNIVDATPFKRDVMKELAEACRKHGLKMCFYYSQAQDWHAPGGAGHWDEVGEAGWHGATMPAEPFARYLEEKVKPQLRELLTQYGPIGLIWFDTPVVITREQSLDLRRFVHSLQPECLVSGRVGHGVGDYGSLGDNQIPFSRMRGDWEVPATLNDTWGYKKNDQHWKSTGTLLGLLAEIAGKGANYLLNIGPTGDGEIPPATVERLEAIGKWMQVNGVAIYGSSASPYDYAFPWGTLTRKARVLYVLLTQWTRSFKLRGLQSSVAKAWLLAEPQARLSFHQSLGAGGIHELTVELPAQAPDPLVSVLALEMNEEIRVEMLPLQQPDGSIQLPIHLAAFVDEKGPRSPTLMNDGLLSGWTNANDYVAWTVRVQDAGVYEARLTLGSPEWEKAVASGHRVALSIGANVQRGELRSEEPIRNVRTVHHFQAISALGKIRIEAPGEYRVELRAEKLAEGAKEGLALLAVELRPAG
ncbi:MAG: alpha-L-fucosidase [Spirochaetes bacterium]|nr:alpha-L-fucosidase [Spirochaetota bacterium]